MKTYFKKVLYSLVFARENPLTVVLVLFVPSKAKFYVLTSAN